MICVATSVFKGAGASALRGDFYRPCGDGPFPAVVAVPGGGWLRGRRQALRFWGEQLAMAGLAFFAIDHTLSTDGPTFPQNAEDVADALGFLFESHRAFAVDPARLGLLGASSGAHLATLVAFSPDFAAPRVRAVVGVYGIYDLTAQWGADQRRVLRAPIAPVERMIGASPTDAAEIYAAASPISHVAAMTRPPSVLLIWGDRDQIVLPQQSEGFAAALERSGVPVARYPVAGAAHFWFSDNDEANTAYRAMVAPRLIDFLRRTLCTAE